MDTKTLPRLVERARRIPRGEMVPVTWEEFKYFTWAMLPSPIPQPWPTIYGREVWVTDADEERIRHKTVPWLGPTPIEIIKRDIAAIAEYLDKQG